MSAKITSTSEPKKEKFQLRDAQIGKLLLLPTGHIAMLMYSGLSDILYYDFTLGLRLDAVRNSAHATMLVTEYTSSITIKNE